MIIWSGKGFLPAVVAVVLTFICIKLFTEAIGDYAFVISFYLTGLFSWVFGMKWNIQDERILLDAKTGQKLKLRNSHTLFWIPMQYWGIIFPVVGVIILFQNSIIGGILSIIGFGLIYYWQVYEGQDRNPIVVKNREPKTSQVPVLKKMKSIDKVEIKREDQSPPRETRHKKLSEMSKEELDAYHKRFMPK